MSDPAIEGHPTRSYDAWRARWLHAAAKWPGVSIEVLGSVGPPPAPLPLLVVRISPADPIRKPRRVVITAGIHGDEPAGVAAVTRLLEAPHEWAPILAHFDATIFPCANPTGFTRNHRTNGEGIDLNRTFDQPDPPPETAWIRDQLAPNSVNASFDAAIELHEDSDGEGFYLYELAEGPPYAGDHVVRAVAPLVAIDPRDVIEGFPAERGVIRPDPAMRPDGDSEGWPQALYSFRVGIPMCLTLETPSTMLPIERRAEILLVALKAALANDGRRSAAL
jgi:hypothetical protein